MNRLSIILFLLCLAQIYAMGQEIRSVPSEESEKHLLRKTAPVYPSLARQMRIQGEVKIEIEISDTGNVKILKLISGSPVLASAAIDAVRQWSYSPFVSEGNPIAVKTTVTVPFSLGDTPEQIKESNRKNDLFFQTLKECRNQRTNNRLEDAGKTCRKAVDLSEELDPARQLERMEAAQQMGHALFLQRKFSDALHYYQAELRIGEATLKPTDAELAAAQHHVGNGLWGTGKPEEALAYYEKSESGYKQAEAHIESAFLKDQYRQQLKMVLHDHAAMLRQMGRPEEADKLEKEAASIIVKNLRQDE